MIEELSQMQARIDDMRDGVLKEGSVMPEEGCIITSLAAKKKVLLHLDRLAAAVAGAHRHMSNVERDDFWSATDKEEIQKQIIKRLRQNLGGLPVTIKDYVYCLHKHFEANQLPRPPFELTREEVAERRQEVSEILDQLELLEREVDDMLPMLDAPVA